jgi:hypothetical protein
MVIGPRQTEQDGMVVPRFIRRAVAAKPIVGYGRGRRRGEQASATAARCI